LLIIFLRVQPKPACFRCPVTETHPKFQTQEWCSDYECQQGENEKSVGAIPERDVTWESCILIFLGRTDRRWSYGRLISIISAVTERPLSLRVIDTLCFYARLLLSFVNLTSYLRTNRGMTSLKPNKVDHIPCSGTENLKSALNLPNSIYESESEKIYVTYSLFSLL